MRCLSSVYQQSNKFTKARELEIEAPGLQKQPVKQRTWHPHNPQNIGVCVYCKSDIEDSCVYARTVRNCSVYARKVRKSKAKSNLGAPWAWFQHTPPPELAAPPADLGQNKCPPLSRTLQ